MSSALSLFASLTPFLFLMLFHCTDTDEIMSKKVEERFFYEEEDTKCPPPQHVHWPNQNEVRASHRLEGRISGARSGAYPYEPRMVLEEDENRAKRHMHEHHEKHNASSTGSSSFITQEGAPKH